MSDFVAKTSRWRIVLLAALSLGFVFLGMWMTGLFGEPPISRRLSPSSGTVAAIGWVCVAFFGFTGVMWIRKLFGASEQLRINRAGVRWLPWSAQTIPWSQVVKVTTWSYRGQRTIVLHIRDPSLFPGRGIHAAVAGMNRRLTGGDISISLTGTDRSAGETFDAIAQYRMPS